MSAILPILLIALPFALPWQSPPSGSAKGLPHYQLEIRADPAAGELSGNGRFVARKSGLYRFESRGLTIDSIESATPHRTSGTTIEVELAADQAVELRFRLDLSHKGESSGTIVNDDELLLFGNWYPIPEKMARYTLTAQLPRHFRAIAEAEERHHRVSAMGEEYRFEFPHPLPALHLFASRKWNYYSRRHRGVVIEAFFPEKSADGRPGRELASEYLDATARYLDHYSELLGPYPYKRFTIASTSFPAGHAMPTMTLLGEQLLHLPFILSDSLRHELVHQWFGCAVYVDYSRGNWAEALTTLLADHAAADEAGRSADYRRELLADYRHYRSGNFSLREFRGGRTTTAERVVGYNAGSLLFHTLRHELGEEQFGRFLRAVVDEWRFEIISYEELDQTLASLPAHESGLVERLYRSLRGDNNSAADKEQRITVSQGFFSRWIDIKELPELTLHSVGNAIDIESGGFRLLLDIEISRPELLPLSVPLTIELSGGKTLQTSVALTTEARNEVTLPLLHEPLKVRLDSDYELPRLIAASEVPPTLAAIFASNEVRLVGADEIEAVRPILEIFLRNSAQTSDMVEGLRIMRSGEADLILVGNDHPLRRMLFAERNPNRHLAATTVTAAAPLTELGVSIEVMRNPFAPDRHLLLVNGAMPTEELQRLAPRIHHHGRAARLQLTRQGIENQSPQVAREGVMQRVQSEEMAVPVESLASIDSIARRAIALRHRILYVGEFHTDAAHHLNQLRFIQSLHREGARIAIGMEMFQRPFQSALDDYIAGQIDERTFLKRSEYFERWGYDYNLYKPILDYAREHKIPVVALNMEAEITRQVSREGIDSLSAEQRQRLPSEMDFSDEAYREGLKDIFEQHAGTGLQYFDAFVQAQTIWDETMAESIDRYLRQSDNRNKIMVVLAGNGHLRFHHGIPRRAERRNGWPYTLIVQGEKFEEGVGHYILAPRRIAWPQAVELGVQVRSEEGGVRVLGFGPRSFGRLGGLETDDLIVAVDGVTIESVADLKIALLYVEQGGTTDLMVSRNGNIVELTINFNVQLYQRPHGSPQSRQSTSPHQHAD